MQDTIELCREEYSFDLPPEVVERMQQSESLHELIREENLRDLKSADVSNRPYCRLKRFVDIVCSALGLVALALPMAMVAFSVWLESPGPVVFSQYRIGLHGKRFRLYKFRTMRTDAPKYRATMYLENPERYITRVGHFLRKYSLDEIPQLFNVLKGDMSLVGPRPLISDEYEIHAMRMRFGVYNIRPGVTGLAQINGRDLVTPEEKVRWDVQYLQEFGPVMDFKILLATVPKIADGHDVVEGANKLKK